MGFLLELSQNVCERESECRATVTSQEEGRVGRTLGKSSWPLSHVSRLCQSCPTWHDDVIVPEGQEVPAQAVDAPVLIEVLILGV